MSRASLLVIAVCFLSCECSANSETTADTGNMGGLLDWMRNMRDRMSNRESGRMNLMGSFDFNNLSNMRLPSSVVSMMMSGERMFQPVNLENVKFDPLTDRAYRMGNWYIIRRRSANKDDNVDDWDEFFDRKDDRWEVINNGVEKSIIAQSTKSTARNENDEGAAELLAEVLNVA